MPKSSIWSTDRILSYVTTPGKSGPGNNENEGILCIPQSSSITGASPSDCLVSYQGYSLKEGSYSSAETQSVSATALANWGNFNFVKLCKCQLLLVVNVDVFSFLTFFSFLYFFFISRRSMYFVQICFHCQWNLACIACWLIFTFEQNILRL